MKHTAVLGITALTIFAGCGSPSDEPDAAALADGGIDAGSVAVV